jgi:hypothetical protein
MTALKKMKENRKWQRQPADWRKRQRIGENVALNRNKRSWQWQWRRQSGCKSKAAKMAAMKSAMA